MTTKAVTLARKNGTGADLLLPRTSADLVGYEKKNSTATTVKEALDEMNDNFQGEKPGIVKRVETLEEKVQPFTAPTASAPGTAGLVPGPEATPDVDRLLHYLSVEGWRKLSTSMFSPDLSGSDSQELGLAGVATDSFDANTIITGYYHSNNWTNAPGGSGLLISVPVRDNTAANYAIVQIFFSYLGPSSYRTLRQGIPVGTTPAIDNWAEWQSINSPRPQAAEGVGQWRLLGNNPGQGASLALPDGGVWAYFLIGVAVTTAVPYGAAAGAAGGGTVVTVDPGTASGVSHVFGFCYEVA